MRSGTDSCDTSGTHSADVNEAGRPDFLQIVCAARGTRVAEPADPTGWEERVEFVSPDVVRERQLESDNQLLFLDAALDALGLRP